MLLAPSANDFPPFPFDMLRLNDLVSTAQFAAEVNATCPSSLLCARWSSPKF